MAKNTTEAEVVVTCNGEAARNEIERLEKEIEEYTKAAAEAYQAGDKALGDKMAKKVGQLSKSLDTAKKNVKSMTEVIKNINSATITELTAASKQLQSELKKLSPTEQEFIDKSKQLKQVNLRLTELKQGFKGVVEEQKKLSFKNLSDSFNRYFGIVTAGIGTITGLSLAFRKAAQAAAELDDTYADVMKTTGLTHNEVALLDTDLMKIDTRTSREQLLLLARDAGKLGISGRQEILGFVRAADQIQVALGEDLGEGAIKQLGKIADVLGYTQQMGVEKSLLSIGSAVNAVGQASTASEAYLVEFVQRLAGVGAQAGISAADLIGFASGLDQSAMKVEMASTAFQKFLMKLYEDPAQFAGYAKMEVQEFTDLLKNDANKAITTVLQSLKDQDGFAALVPIFKDMGLDGARAVSVLASMASNLSAITDAQALANVEFEKATSVTEEYGVKNNNLQAQLEKARKEFQNATITLGQSLNPVLLKSTKGVTYLIKVLASSGRQIAIAAMSVAALVIAVKSVTIVHKTYNAVVKAGNVLQSTFTVVTKAASVAINVLRGRTIAATKAFLAMKAAMSASVFGIIAAAVAGLAVVISKLIEKHREAAEAARWQENLEKKVSESFAEEEAKVRTLTKIIESNNVSLESRRKALEELKQIIPDYHADLTKEGKLINNNKTALDAYLNSLRTQARIKIYTEDLEAREAEIMKLEEELDKVKEKEDLVRAGAIKPTKIVANGDFDTDTVEMDQEEAINSVVAERQAIEQQILDLQDKQEIVLNRIGERLNKNTQSLTPQEREIAEITNRYLKMFEQIRNESLDDRKGAEQEISLLKVDMQKEIDAVNDKWAVIKQAEADAAEVGNEYLSQAQFKLLQERYRKLTKSEKELVDKGYAALTEEDSQTLKDRYDRFVEADKRLADKRYNDAVKALDNEQRAQENAAKTKYLAGSLNAEAYERRLLDIKAEYLNKKLKLAENEGKDTSAIQSQIIDMQINDRKRLYDEDLKELENKYKKENLAIETSYAKGEITEKEFESQMLEMKMQYLNKRLELVKNAGLDETTATQAILDAQIDAQKEANKRMEKLREDAQAVRDKLDPKSARRNELDEQLKHLQELYDAELLSDTELKEAKLQLTQEFEEAETKIEREEAEKRLKDKLDKLREYEQKAQGYLNMAANFSSALQSAETAQLEAEYQARLTAAGNNAEEREAIEAEYEQKKLDMQKKYADVDMVINIAKAIAAGALAAVEAFAAAGNPILGAVFAAIVAATTAAEVATIIAQRNAIKNASVSGGGGGGSSAQQTGTRTVNGFSGGGYTDSDASDSKPVGVVHANEWVAPAWMVREDPVKFADLERYRRTRQHSRIRGAGSGFAEGGYTGGGNVQNNIVIDAKAIGTAVADAVGDTLAKKPLRSYVVRNDIKEIDDQDARFKKQTSR